ncbi:uncharacterized protein LOC144422065 isoform X2 [Styela clava]
MKRIIVSIMLSAAVMLMLLNGTYGLMNLGDECFRDQDCKDLTRCEFSTGNCRECQEDRDCDCGHICDKRINGCRAGECGKDDDCFDGKFCYTTWGTCKECKNDQDCGDDQSCFSGDCRYQGDEI